jgi:Xaa-Pro aminopeptidase
MTTRSWAALVLLGAAALAGAQTIPLSEYKQRRAALRGLVGDNVVILFGKTEGEHGDIRSGFFQEPNFFYLTGWREPGAVLVLTPKSEALLLPRRDKELEHWTGPKAAPGDSAITQTSGFDVVLPVQDLELKLASWLSEGRHLYTLLDSEGAEALRKLAPLRQVRSMAGMMARLRMKKSAAEIAALQRSTDAAVEAHLAAWKRIKPGLFEYQVAAAMSNVYHDAGCERHAYAPIVGSGPNGAVLHYSRNSRRMDGGELILMDVGPECSMYAADITRTVPVNGRFTKRQRELYEIVLGAQNAAIAAVKPGVTFGSRTNRTGLQKLVIDYFDKHGGLGKYFTHGLGHHVGLDVHDAFDPAAPLEAGMVITIEPGLYIPEEGIGIRIEDMVLVTENGARILSEKLPRQPAEIERRMAQR